MTNVYVVFRSNYHDCADNWYTPSHMEAFQNREDAARYAANLIRSGCEDGYVYEDGDVTTPDQIERHLKEFDDDFTIAMFDQDIYNYDDYFEVCIRKLPVK